MVRSEQAPQSPANSADIFSGGGVLGAEMRGLDWSRTQIGPVPAWPQSLRTTLSICLASRFPILIWWSLDLVMLYNDAYRPMLGVKHPASLGRPGREVWSEIWDIIGPMLDGVMTRGDATWSEDQMLPLERNGFAEECYFTFSYSPIRDESGGIGGVFTAVTETTARVLGERRLQTLRELAERTTGAGSPEQACLLAAQVLADNDADLPFALLYLLDPDAPLARLAGTAGILAGDVSSPLTVDLAIPEEDDGVWALGRAVRDGALVLEDVRRRAGALPGGPWSEVPERAVVLPIAQPGQERPAGVLVAGLSPRLPLDDTYRGFLDLVGSHVASAIADASAHEAERQRAEALAELDRAKTIFFSNVSHEFRTPLTLMLGPLEALLEGDDGALNPAERDELELVRRNALRLLKLVNTLLDFSRIEAARIDASYEPTDLPALTADLASSFRSAIERSGLRFVIDCPPLPEDVQVFVDREMWEKIVLNLLSNALKFTFAGEITVAVRLSADRSRVELVVRDTGVGIPAEEIPRLFERFHRIRNRRGRTHEGTGIGLSLVQELVRLHGGEVRVISQPDAGTTFIISIPTGSAHLAAEHLRAPRQLALAGLGSAPFLEEAERWLPGVPASPETAAEPRPVSDRRVLVVDDNRDMRTYLVRLLSQWWSVESAAGGEEALAAVRREPPDLVLADVMMPEMDGFALLNALRSGPRTRTIPVILLSARAGEAAAVEGLAAGADDYLIKPFAARELVARISAQLELAQLRREAIRAREELLSMAAHELKTPLTTVKASAQYLGRLLVQPEIDRERIGRYQQDLLRHIARLELLIADLLDVSRVQHGRLELRPEPVDLSRLAGQVLERFATAPERRAEHRLVLDAPEPVVGSWDPVRLDQVLTNLISNGLKYSPSGGEVTVRVRRAGDQAELQVGDQGVGISPADQARLFQPFSRGRDDQIAVSGTGLGLYIAEQIVTLHAGSITVESEPGRGSLFTVRLPLTPAAA